MSKPEILMRLKQSIYARNIGRLLRGNLIAQILQVLALPVISRIYSPSDFGIYTVLMAFIGFIVVGLTLRFESILLISDPEEVNCLLSVSVRLSVLISFLGSTILAFLVYNGLFGFGILPLWMVALTVPILAGYGFFNTGRAYSLRHGDARTVSQARVEKSLGNILTKILAGLVWPGPAGLIIGELVGAWSAFRRVDFGFRSVFSKSSALLQKQFLQIWQKYRKFPLLELPSTLADQAALLLPVAMIAALGGAKAAGAYGMARIIVVLPNSQIGRAVADGFQSRAGELVRQGRLHCILRLSLKSMGMLAVVGLIPYSLFYLLSPWVFPFILGSDWTLAGKFASLLSIWMFVAFVISPVSRILSVLQKQEYKLLYDVFVLSGSLLIYIHARQVGMEPMRFLSYLVSLNLVGYALYAFLIISITGRITKLVKNNDVN